MREGGLDPRLEEHEAWLAASRRWRERGQFPVHDPGISVFQVAWILAHSFDDPSEHTDDEKRQGRLK